jgi:hypothetical protein
MRPGIFHTIVGEVVFDRIRNMSYHTSEIRNTIRVVVVCLSSSVEGTVIWMKSFHITVSEGTGDPVRRSVIGTLRGAGYFEARFVE